MDNIKIIRELLENINDCVDSVINYIREFNNYEDRKKLICILEFMTNQGLIDGLLKLSDDVNNGIIEEYSERLGLTVKGKNILSQIQNGTTETDKLFLGNDKIGFLKLELECILIRAGINNVDIVILEESGIYNVHINYDNNPIVFFFSNEKYKLSYSQNNINEKDREIIGLIKQEEKNILDLLKKYF